VDELRLQLTEAMIGTLAGAHVPDEAREHAPPDRLDLRDRELEREDAAVLALPEDLAAQLRGFSEDGTLPIPVLSGEVASETTEVGGAPATVLTDAGGVMAGVVWVEDGVVTAVAGTLSTDEVLAVARDVASGR